jgi:hypothetical protein
MAIGLSLTSFACTSSALKNSADQSSQVEEPRAVSTRINDGTYPVQQATYDDGSGEYSLMLLNTQPGDSSVFRATNLQMARLSDEEIAAGKKAYLKVENQQPVLYMPEDYRIEYVHNVTETQANPQTGQSEQVVVRRESNFWAPFAGALAGQALGNLLFTPHYYMPPVYVPGTVLTGYGGYGRSYTDAVSSYRSKYNAPPAEVKNRQVFRTTGQLRRAPSSTSAPNLDKSNRSTGSGYGSSTLRRSDKSYPSRVRGSGGFGSGRRMGGRVGGRRR